MLWYKAWLETRWRFLLCLAGLLVFCVFFVVFKGTGDDFERLPAWAFSTRNQRMMLFMAHQYLVLWWTVAAMLLAMGGLLRERALGLSLFTLALPATRTRLVFSRIGLGMAEAIALALVPCLAIMAVLYFYLRQPVPFQYLGFLMLALLGGGLLLFALAILISSLVEGEYTAPAAALGMVFAMFFVGNVVERLQAYSIPRFMALRGYIDTNTWQISTPFPWTMLSMCLLATVVLFSISVWLIERRDF
jgi:ABC-2 type transport system permease protein